MHLRPHNGESLRRFLSLIVLAMATGAWAQASPSAAGGAPAREKFSGAWWNQSDPEERSGFLNGAADCLTWTVHKKGFNGTPEQLEDKITKFYKLHPEAASLSVVDVWEKVAEQPKASKVEEDQGEVWKNAHWYLNGEWWRQVSEAEQLGFLEGYLWCLRTQVPASTERYSKSASSYRQRIDTFVRANPKLAKEAVATTLHRFRDQNIVDSPQQ